MKRGRWKKLEFVTALVFAITVGIIGLNILLYFRTENIIFDQGTSSLKYEYNFSEAVVELTKKDVVTLELVKSELEKYQSAPSIQKITLKTFHILKYQLKNEFSSQDADFSNFKAMDEPEQWFSWSHVVPPRATNLEPALRYLKESKILRADVTEHIGTQLKILLHLEGNVKALFKPKWYSYDQMIPGDVYSGKDRHTAEILAFYAGFLLGFRRSPLVSGRIIDLRNEILPVATEALKETFLNNGTNMCFYGVCYYCNRDDYVCADGEKIEGAVVRWLPKGVKLGNVRSPWARTYSKKRPLAKWEKNPYFCSAFKSNSSYTQRLLDIIDSSIFDFVLSNGDRHDLEFSRNFKNATLLLIDNGKSLRDTRDHLDILAPLYQCCMIRESTKTQLNVFQRDQFSRLLAEVSSRDPISPLATREQYDAMDRRLGIVKVVINLCQKVFKEDKVVF